MINQSLRTYKYSLSYFLLFYTTKYAISCTLCSVMSHVVLFAYRIILNISTRNTVTKILQKKLYFEFKSSLQYNQENAGQNLVSYRHFNFVIRIY